LKNLPNNANLFTCDAESLNTNIDNKRMDKRLLPWSPTNISFWIPPKCTTNHHTNNIFQFGDAFWLQTCGTSTGTSCTCSYATLYWAYIECKYILPKWLPLLPFLWRFIDDKLGIWTSSEEELKLFLQDTNSYSQLNWTSNGLTSSVNFLDLTLTIEENNLPKTHKPSHIHSTRLSTPTECPKKTYLLQPTMILETRHICHRLGNYC
jgi:hypothetical protein